MLNRPSVSFFSISGLTLGGIQVHWACRFISNLGSIYSCRPSGPPGSVPTTNALNACSHRHKAYRHSSAQTDTQTHTQIHGGDGRRIGKKGKRNRVEKGRANNPLECFGGCHSPAETFNLDNITLIKACRLWNELSLSLSLFWLFHAHILHLAPLATRALSALVLSNSIKSNTRRVWE